MRLLLSLYLMAVFLWACKAGKNDDPGFHFPAEWEEQGSVWLGWGRDTAIQGVQLQMVKALSPHVPITILSRSDSVQQMALSRMAALGIDTAKVRRYIHYIPNIFIRDAGPRFLRNEKGQLAIADFSWGNYGYPKAFEIHQFSDRRGEIDNALAAKMNAGVVSTDMVAEGGAIDVSSTLLLCFSETALQRNPKRSLEQIEQEYLRVYGKQKMIWLDRMPLMDKVVAGPKAGNYFGYGANGHTDEFVRFVNDSTVVIAQIDAAEKELDPVSMVDYGILRNNLALLQNASNERGRPFHIITLPVPCYAYYVEKNILSDSMKNEGDGKIFFKDFKAGQEICWLPAVSYLNFFISNKIVLAPAYWHPGLPTGEREKDEKVKETLQKLFPGREIVQINPIGLNRYGGGMHCATQQQPK